MKKLQRSANPRIQLALAEHARLTRELQAFESRPARDPQLVASLRMCRSRIERTLRAERL